MSKSSALIAQYAHIGAQTRLAELKAEIAQIERAFPDLAPRGGPGRRSAAPSASANAGDGQTGGPHQPVGRKRRRRKPMTAAQKKAVGDRMRKYWAARRKADKKA